MRKYIIWGVLVGCLWAVDVEAKFVCCNPPSIKCGDDKIPVPDELGCIRECIPCKCEDGMFITEAKGEKVCAMAGSCIKADGTKCCKDQTCCIGPELKRNCCEKEEVCCDGDCCAKGSQCCSGEEESFCCTEVERCCGEICCGANDECCGGESGDFCCPEDAPFCCGDGACCNDTEKCCGDHCCPIDGDCCGDGCCNNGQYCADASEGVCCADGQEYCDGNCCDSCSPSCGTCQEISTVDGCPTCVSIYGCCPPGQWWLE